ncbi:hypothetical protein ES703_73627 [subsurface metagenome]
MYVNKPGHDIFAGYIYDLVTAVRLAGKCDPAIAKDNIGAFNTLGCYHEAAFESNCFHIDLQFPGLW